MSTPLKQKLINRVVARVMGTLTHVTTTAPVVALTFDDGPDPEFTPRLLDILDRYQAKATFFVTGQAAQQHRDIIERMARSGHTIGNHTWDHPSIPLINRAERLRQLRTCATAVAPHGAKLFRPPYGNQNFASNLDVWLLGYQVVTWNILAQDWRNDSVEELVERVALSLQPGSIVLLHDALCDAESVESFDRRHTLLAVEQILAQFHHQFQFVTVPELMRYGEPRYRYWERMPNVQWLNSLHHQNGQARQYL